MMYMMMILLQEEETQRKGFVFIAYNCRKVRIQMQFHIMRQCYWIRNAFSERLVGIHICYDDPSMRPYIAGCKLLMLKAERIRFRAHFGNGQETLFQLQTYGIDTTILPTCFPADGSVCVSWHREWTRIQREKGNN